ncbi:MAG: maleylpyruvate isomerase [Micrococcales bacterium 32-70-13]|nr:MAG: maleylpyruvate isomerase [Micrococcales bacterium 32-70-13]
MVARTDNVSDPQLAAALSLMRRGQAFWARKLNEVRDADFDAPSRLPGWSRRHLIAHVGFNARAVARLVEWASTGVETPMYSSPEQRSEEIEFGATLPTEALRNLCAHAAIHLNVSWRDLPEEAWTHEVRTAQGRIVPASETVWIRTREVWIHAVDLNNGARVADFPPELIDALLDDIVRVWRRKRSPLEENITLQATDRARAVSIRDDDEGLVVRGTAVDLVGWGIGRSMRGVVRADGSPAPRAPEWL